MTSPESLPKILNFRLKISIRDLSMGCTHTDIYIWRNAFISVQVLSDLKFARLASRDLKKRDRENNEVVEIISFLKNINLFILVGGWLLYNIVLVLPYINMNPSQVYMCSPSWTPLPPPSPYHPSGLSQCTSPKHPVSYIKPGLATRFICGTFYLLIYYILHSFYYALPQ